MSIVAGHTEPQEGAWPGENVPGEVTEVKARLPSDLVFVTKSALSWLSYSFLHGFRDSHTVSQDCHMTGDSQMMSHDIGQSNDVTGQTSTVCAAKRT